MTNTEQALREALRLAVCPDCHSHEARSMMATDLKSKMPCRLGRRQFKACGNIGMCRADCPHSKTVRVTCEHPFHAAAVHALATPVHPETPEPFDVTKIKYKSETPATCKTCGWSRMSALLTPSGIAQLCPECGEWRNVYTADEGTSGFVPPTPTEED